MRRKLRTAQALSPGEWWLLVQAWMSLLAADIALRVLPLGRVQRLLALGVGRAAPPVSAATPAVIASTQQNVARAARHHLYPMRCLRRSLALQGMLRRRGIETVLQIGVRKQGEGIVAHAWLEYDGQALGEPETLTADFLPLVAAGRNR